MMTLIFSRYLKVLLLVPVLATVLSACQQPVEEATVSLDTPEQRLSYGIALRMGQRMLEDDMVVDVEAYAAGLRDAMEGLEQQLTDEEINAEMMAFQERIQSERDAAVAAEAGANAEQGAAFLAENGQREGVVTTDTGLQYEVIAAGEGGHPGLDDTVEVHYEGSLIDGTVFDSSIQRGQTVSFGVTQVIPGWTEALQLMQPGAKFRLYIPSELAYGAGGAGQLIGPNATLIFDVELISIAD